MFVLHATWLCSGHTPSSGGSLALWAEATPGPPPAARRGSRPKVSRHPFAADAEALDQNLGVFPDGAVPVSAALLHVALPGRGGKPLPSPELLAEVGSGDAEPSLAKWQVAGRLLPPARALRWLSNIPERDRLPPTIALGADLRFWQLAARFQLSLLARQRFVPTLLAKEKWSDVWNKIWTRPPDRRENSVDAAHPNNPVDPYIRRLAEREATVNRGQLPHAT